jgi:hypothetical protein
MAVLKISASMQFSAIYFNPASWAAVSGLFANYVLYGKRGLKVAKKLRLPVASGGCEPPAK